MPLYPSVPQGHRPPRENLESRRREPRPRASRESRRYLGPGGDNKRDKRRRPAAAHPDQLPYGARHARPTPRVSFSGSPAATVAPRGLTLCRRPHVCLEEAVWDPVVPRHVGPCAATTPARRGLARDVSVDSPSRPLPCRLRLPLLQAYRLQLRPASDGYKTFASTPSREALLNFSFSPGDYSGH